MAAPSVLTTTSAVFTGLTLQVEKPRERGRGLAEDAGGLLNWFESYLLLKAGVMLPPKVGQAPREWGGSPKGAPFRRVLELGVEEPPSSCTYLLCGFPCVCRVCLLSAHRVLLCAFLTKNISDLDEASDEI